MKFYKIYPWIPILGIIPTMLGGYEAGEYLDNPLVFLGTLIMQTSIFWLWLLFI